MLQWSVQCQWSLTAVFSLHTTGNACNITDGEYCIPTSSSDIVLLLWLLCVAVFSFLPLQSVSPSLFNMLQWCVRCQWSLLLTAVFSLHTTGNALNITESEYCIPTSSSGNVLLLWLCVAIFSFFPPQAVSPTLPHAPVVYAVSVILGIDCRVFSPHYWECMQHNR